MASSSFSAIERTLASLVVDNRQASLPVTIVSNKIFQIRKCHAIFFDFYFPAGAIKMLFMVLPLLGDDLRPRLDLNIISPFPSRAAGGLMSFLIRVKTSFCDVEFSFGR